LEKVIKGIGHLGRLIAKPFILLPLVYLLLSNIFPPDYSSMIQYMFTKKLSVPLATLSIVDNVGVILYYFFFLWLINKLKGIPLWKMFVFGNLSKVFNILQASVFFDIPHWGQLTCRFLNNLTGRLSSDFFLLPIIGRIGKFLPEGFESTGVVVIISCLNFAGTTSGKLGSNQ
jgi:hypothetical protein